MARARGVSWVGSVCAFTVCFLDLVPCCSLLAKGLLGTSWGSSREELFQKSPGDSEIEFSMDFIFPSTTCVIFGKLRNLKTAGYPLVPSESSSEKRKD